MDFPQLEAMEDEWDQHPPVHRLVGWYLGYESKTQAPATADEESDGGGASALSHAGMGGVPPTQAVLDATTREEALAAYERQFFGEVKDVNQL